MLFAMLNKTLVPLDMELLSFLACLVFALISACFLSAATLKDFSAKKKGQGYFVGERRARGRSENDLTK